MRYDHFDGVGAPVSVIERDGTVIYRNRAALNLSGIFRMGGRLRGCFEDENVIDACVRYKKLQIGRLTLPDDRVRTVLLTPDFSPEGAHVLLFLAPILEGDLFRAPSVRETGREPFIAGTSTGFVKEDLLPYGRLLLDAYARLPAHLALKALAVERFTVGGACMFINRLFERCDPLKKASVEAKCTSDCVGWEVPGFTELSACLVYLSVLLCADAEQRSIRMIFSCEKERLHILIDAVTKKREGSELAEIFPERRVEFTILAALFDRLAYDLHVCFFGDRLSLELVCRTRFSAHYFKAPDEYARRLETLAVETLLSDYGYPAELYLADKEKEEGSTP